MSEGREKATTFPVHCQACDKELRLPIAWCRLALAAPDRLRAWRCTACGAADWILYKAGKALDAAYRADLQKRADALGIVVGEPRAGSACRLSTSGRRTRKLRCTHWIG